MAVAAAFASSAPARVDATCTQAQKDTRVAAAALYAKRMPAQRRAYFARVRSTTMRAAFVRRQQARLRALRAAAACTVPSLPPSSAASCDIQLARNPEDLLWERQTGSPVLGVGAITKDAVMPASGSKSAVLIFVDFPNAPASETASGIASSFTAYANWFAEASYGRFSLSVTPVATWFRMPQPGSDYRMYTVGGVEAYMRDVVAAADGAVNFAQYDAVWVVAASNGGLTGNTAFSRMPGRGIPADGVEVRFAALHGSNRWPGLFHSTVMMHEHLHALGLPDLGYSDKQLGRWDPLFADNEGTSTTHVLGWHKWLLGWLDPSQLTCQREAGPVEETLTPLAKSGGKKLVVVPTSDATAYVVEVRTKVGYDRTICTEGVLVYTIDSRVRNGGGPVEGKSATNRCSPQTSPLTAGQTFEDAAVMVEVLATDGSAYRVRVTKK